MAKALLDCPCACGLEITATKDGESVLVALGEVLRLVQPEVLGPREALVAGRDKGPVLLLAHGVERFLVLAGEVPSQEDFLCGGRSSHTTGGAQARPRWDRTEARAPPAALLSSAMSSRFIARAASRVSFNSLTSASS